MITRLGVCGIPRPPYGSFAGKLETEAPEVSGGAGRPEKLVILPDGKRVYLDDRQIEELRIRLSRQKPNKKQARRIKKAQPEQQTIEVPQSPDIPLPPLFAVIPVDQQAARIQAEISEILRIEEEDTLALLLMVS